MQAEWGKRGNYSHWAETTKQSIKCKQYIIMNKNTDLRECKAKYLRWINKNKHEIFIIFIEHDPCFPRNNFQLTLGCHKSVTLLSHLHFTLFRYEILWTYFINNKYKTKNQVLNKKLEEWCPKGRLTTTRAMGLQKYHIHIQTDTGRKEKVLWEDIHTYSGV
jgi:hypothetical protein